MYGDLEGDMYNQDQAGGELDERREEDAFMGEQVHIADFNSYDLE